MSRYVWGMDLSLKNTGISIFTDDGEFVQVISIETKSDEETQIRLQKIGNKLLMLKGVFVPSRIIIEKGFYRFNISTEQIFRVHGLVNYLFADVEQIYYPATTIKKVVGGKGNMKKEALQEIIKTKYSHIKFDNLDQSDSFAIALTYFYDKGILKNG